MRVLIIEDEPTAAKRLSNLLKKLDQDIEVAGITDSIESSVEFFNDNSDQLDLILCDIHLADGLSFEIFKKVEVDTPIIFITAYDQYAIDAFKLNSIDYLLKPIKKKELEHSIEMFDKYRNANQSSFDYDELIKQVRGEDDGQPKRLIVKYGQNMKTVELSDVAYFYTENKIVFLTTFNKEKYAVDMNLEQLQDILDEKVFFRINRQFIINVNAIDRMVSISKSRVKIYAKPESEFEMVVSVERSPHFKKWLAG